MRASLRRGEGADLRMSVSDQGMQVGFCWVGLAHETRGLDIYIFCPPVQLPSMGRRDQLLDPCELA
jgi:hypothetical protein